MGEEVEQFSELIKLQQLSESNPQQLIDFMEKIRQAKKEEKEDSLPEELKVLAKYIYPVETLRKRGFYEYLLLDEYSLSYATPKAFGAYRARKISSLFYEEKVVDVSCGVGSQLLELCRELSAIGIEKDPVRYWLAKINVNVAFQKKYIPIKPEIFNEDALSSEKIAPLIKEFEVILCDSWRAENGYSPDLKELHSLYPDKYIVYEFKPLEKVKELMEKYPFLFGKSEIEYYGEEDRCSRLTVYYGKGKTIGFYQDDEYSSAGLSYNHERLDSVMVQMQQKVVAGFPSHDFYVLNRCIVDNYFASLLNFTIFGIDKKRYVVEVNSGGTIKPKKTFSPVFSSSQIEEVSAFLQENYEDYMVTLRMEIPSEEYWNFISEHKLITNKDSLNRFSLFKQGKVYHLAEEKLARLKE
ncbi:hypothetical protein HZC32_01155 [Candidatus Woesearchaeota archaeon]|nr:hypothetical protein [Candidatus Woesearchaeota archaeon]